MSESAAQSSAGIAAVRQADFGRWLRAHILARGVSQQSVALGIGVTQRMVWLWVSGRSRPHMNTVGRIATYFDTDPSVVVSMVCDEKEMSPFGRVIAPAMARAGLDHRKLAAAAATSEGTVGRLLWVSRPARKSTLRQVANVLSIEVTELERAQRKIKEQVPRQPLGGWIKRILHREGRDGLRRHAREASHPWDDLTKEARKAQSRALAVPATRGRFASSTEEDHARWRRSSVATRPKAIFGLCRVCGKICMCGPNDRREVHTLCFRKWSAGNGGRKALPPYSPRRRLSPAELADYYEAAVLYMRVKDHTPSGQRKGIVPRTVRDLAFTKLGLARNPEAAERRLRERVRRLLDLLPDLAVCDSNEVRRVRALISSRRYLPATTK